MQQTKTNDSFLVSSSDLLKLNFPEDVWRWNIARCLSVDGFNVDIDTQISVSIDEIAYRRRGLFPTSYKPKF
jgi:hypothetical protein